LQQAMIKFSKSGYLEDEVTQKSEQWNSCQKKLEVSNRLIHEISKLSKIDDAAHLPSLDFWSNLIKVMMVSISSDGPSGTTANLVDQPNMLSAILCSVVDESA